MPKHPTRYALAAIAAQDVDDIFDYTEKEFGFDQALDYLESLEASLLQLVDNPESGRHRSDIREGLRSKDCNSHVIFYRILDDHIRIVRVLHSSRDLPRWV